MNTDILKPIDPDLRLLRKLAYQFQQDALDGIWHDDSDEDAIDDIDEIYSKLYSKKGDIPK